MDIKILEGEDWECLYVDDKLVYQGCEVEVESVLTAIAEYLETNSLTKENFKFEYFDCYEYLVENSLMPDKFNEDLVDE